MVRLLQEARGIVGMIAFLISVFLTFDGKPLALVSFVGAGIVMTGVTVATATITHEKVGEGIEGPGPRILRICLSFAIASLGAAMVTWGDLVSVTFFDNITIGFRETGIVVGIVSGLFNIDKTWQKF